MGSFLDKDNNILKSEVVSDDRFKQSPQALKSLLVCWLFVSGTLGRQRSLVLYEEIDGNEM